MSRQRLPGLLSAYLWVHVPLLAAMALLLQAAPPPTDSFLLALLVLAGLLPSLWRVTLPFAQAKMSPTIGVVCAALLLQGPLAALVCSLAGAAVSLYVKPLGGRRFQLRRPTGYRVWLSLANCALATGAAALAAEATRGSGLGPDPALLARVLVFALVFYLVNTGGISLGIALDARRPWREVWRQNFLWTAPGYLASASIAGIVYYLFAVADLGVLSLLFLPVVYVVYYSYRMHVERLQSLSARVEEGRAESEELHRRNQALLEASPLAIFSLDRRGAVQSWNGAAARLLGWSADEALGQPLPLFTGGCGARLAAEALAGSALADAETVLRRRDGTSVEASVSVAPLYAAHREVDGALFIAADIRERKRTEDAVREQQLRSLMLHGSDIVATLTPGGRFQYQSPSLERVLGYRTEELLDTPMPELVHPDDRGAALSMLEESRLGVRGDAVVELRARHRDGGWRQLEVVCSGLLDDPSVRGIVFNAHDVTERHSLLAQLRQAQKMEAVGRLAGGVAHDFNNMLAVINGYSELLLERVPPDSPIRAGLADIHSAGQRAANLTRQLLAFSRKQILAPQLLELNQVVAAVERILRHVIGEDIQLVIELDPDPGLVRADPTQIEQTLLNLVVNARDAMPRGGRLVLGTRAVAVAESVVPNRPAGEPDRYVLLYVSDTGTGMDEETRARIFEPFFTTKEQGKGTGLGLATVYGIVKQSGGYIDVESAPGRGSTFRIYLPCADVPAHELPGAEPGMIGAGPALESPPPERETVLLVEDEPMVRQFTRLQLASMGYRVLEAANGFEALDVARNHRGPLDLLLSDVVMPRMSGRELAERLAAERPGVKVLFMSGHTEDTVLRHGVADSTVICLQKPFKIQTLQARLREVLEGQSPAR